MSTIRRLLVVIAVGIGAGGSMAGRLRRSCRCVQTVVIAGGISMVLTGCVWNTAVPRVSSTDPNNTEHTAVLTTDGGSWGGTPPIVLSYQWQACNYPDPATAGFACKSASGDGAGATASSFTPGEKDVNYYLRVAVTATDSASPPTRATAYSAPTQSKVSVQWLTTDVTCSAAGSPRGTILYLHAGGFILNLSVDSAQRVCHEWAARGYDTNVVAYPLGDVAAAESYSRQVAATTPGRPVFAVGESAGGTLAEWLGVHGDVRAAVANAGISDLTTYSDDSFWAWFGISLAERAALSPISAVAASTAPSPLSMFHSPADSVVDYQQSVNMLASMQARCGTCASLTDLTRGHLEDQSWKDTAAGWFGSVLTAPAIEATGSTGFTVGSQNTLTLKASGSPRPTLTVSGPLPVGVNFVDNKDGTATLTGAPGTAARGRYRIAVHADGGTQPDATLLLTLTVRTNDDPPLDPPPSAGRPTETGPPSAPLAGDALARALKRLCIADMPALGGRPSIYPECR